MSSKVTFPKKNKAVLEYERGPRRNQLTITRHDDMNMIVIGGFLSFDLSVSPIIRAILRKLEKEQE
jgi:hypothetical protein